MTKGELRDLFDAWLDGKEIQLYSIHKEEWIDIKNPIWDKKTKYRVKPTKIEFKDCSFNEEEYGVNTWGRIAAFTIEDYDIEHRKCFIKDIKTAEAYAVLPQLIRIMGQYNEDWIPDWKDGSIKYILYYYNDNITKNHTSNTRSLLAFKSEEIRDKFLEDHKDLIEIAKPLL